MVVMVMALVIAMVMRTVVMRVYKANKEKRNRSVLSCLIRDLSVPEKW